MIKYIALNTFTYKKNCFRLSLEVEGKKIGCSCTPKLMVALTAVEQGLLKTGPARKECNLSAVTSSSMRDVVVFLKLSFPDLEFQR